jgi:hypothetical protein
MLPVPTRLLRRWLDKFFSRVDGGVYTSDQRMLHTLLAMCALRLRAGCLPCQDMFTEG